MMLEPGCGRMKFAAFVARIFISTRAISSTLSERQSSQTQSAAHREGLCDLG